MAVCGRCSTDNAPGARYCSGCGALLAGLDADAPPAPHEVRKTVTVLFADITSSTALGERHDPEAVRRVMGRYYQEMRAVIERHGGTVEKFIGDAVMAVFGIPVIHEDDAMRAVRAALEMREVLASVNPELEQQWGVRLEGRIGVNTGEVVAGDPSHGEQFATGDAVNVAARLEEAAPPGDVLVGHDTYLLVRNEIELEFVDPLSLKGKEEPVIAYRAVSRRPDVGVAVRQFDSPLVDRVTELASLEAAFESAASERSCQLFALLGAPGLGKSRLAAEALTRIGDRASVLIGRCLPYGEGITYWPMVEAVKQAAGIADGDSAEHVRSKVAALLDGGDEDPLVAERIAQVIGVADSAATSDETFWALRKLLEGIASTRPLVLLLEDAHWAEPTLLDLIEYLADWSRNVPLFVLCLARPELLETRPLWFREPGRTCVLLEPFGDAETDVLIDSRLKATALDDSARERIKGAAEGNPFFVEQMLASIEEGGDGADAAVPPTIQTLLAARLDRLDLEERRVIERASVMGRFFWWEAVLELSPEDSRPRVSEHLMALVRKELIVPERSGAGREHSFRFRHALIRDAAYAGISKEARSLLHERFALWLEDRSPEYDEIVGYHLEQAFRYREELGPLDDRARALAAHGGWLLAVAGDRAQSRGDLLAAANLFERALALLPEETPERLELLCDLGRALIQIGSLARAEEVLTEAIESAEAIGDRRVRSNALVSRAALRIYTQPDLEHGTEELMQVTEEAVRVFEECGDHLGLARAWSKLAEVYWSRCQYAAMEEVLERALNHARKAGDDLECAIILNGLARAAVLGPTPVEAGIQRCRSILEQTRSSALEAILGLVTGWFEAMRGNFDEARALYTQSRAIFEEFGLKRWIAAYPVWAGPTELVTGDFARAESELRRGYDLLRAIGDRGTLSPVAAFLAQAVYAQGRYDEADELASVSEECASRDDRFPHVVWRGVRAKVLARRGELDEATRLAREAVALADETDSLNLQGDAWVNLAEVLRLGMSHAEADECIERAVRLYEAKGNVASAGSARALLAGIGGAA